MAVTTLLGAPASRVTLHNIQLSFLWITLRAVGQFPWQTRAIQTALPASQFTSTTGSLSGPGGSLPVRLISLDELAGLAAGAGTLLVGTYAPGNYHLKVTSGTETLLDAGVTLAGGSGAKVLELPAP